jgi:glycolate oxidase
MDKFAFLKEKFADQYLPREAISEDFAHDEMGAVVAYPDALVYCTSTEDVSAVLTYANETRVPVVVRGSGTGLVGGSVAVHGGIMIDLSRMNQILSHDLKNMTVTVEAGVLLIQLNDYLKDFDVFYPPDPGEKSATIGGNISTNAGGMRAIKYGVTRDYVRALKVVTPSGEVMNFGGSVAKNSSGYSLKDLIIGSEGTLAVVCEATLKILAAPRFSVSLLVGYNDGNAAIACVPKIFSSEILPTALEYMSRRTILFSEDYLGKRFPNTDFDAYLLLSFDGASKDFIEYQYRTIADLCLEQGAEDVFIIDTDERYDSVWSARGAFLEGIKASSTQMEECDVVVPVEHVSDFLLYTKTVEETCQVRIESFGHAGDGNLHIYLLRDDLTEQQYENRLNTGFEMLYTKAFEYGGMVSGEHGIGYAKRAFLKTQLGQSQISLMNGVKAAFDPNNILNPGKVIQ